MTESGRPPSPKVFSMYSIRPFISSRTKLTFMDSNFLSTLRAMM